MRIILFNILIVVSICSFSQKNYFAEIKLNNGFVAPHRIGMDGLADKPSYGFDICVFNNNIKNNYYDIKYNKPYTGYGIMWQNLGNPNVLGQSMAVYSFMEFHYMKNKKIKISTRVNGGLNYLTKFYDKIDNPQHIAIGTHINFFFKLDVGLVYCLPNTPIALRLNGGLIHFSNGSVKKPNLGLNQINFNLGVSYQMNNVDGVEDLSKANVKPEKRNEFTLMATLTSADEYTVQPEGRGGGFLCSTGAIGYNYIYSQLGKVGISADVFYNENLYYWYDERWDTLVRVHDEPSEIIRAGISLGHELVYKKLSLISYVGFYYYNKVKPHDFMYSRFGLRYYIHRNIFLNASIKAYGFKAHYIESGIGFSLKK